MSTPTQNNLQAAKHILRYLQGTLHFGIAFTPGPISLSAYCDSDWARDPVDRCSLTGMVLFFGNCPISWFAKKQGTVSVRLNLINHLVDCIPRQICLYFSN